MWNIDLHGLDWNLDLTMNEIVVRVRCFNGYMDVAQEMRMNVERIGGFSCLAI